MIPSFFEDISDGKTYTSVCHHFYLKNILFQIRALLQHFNHAARSSVSSGTFSLPCFFISLTNSLLISCHLLTKSCIYSFSCHNQQEPVTVFYTSTTWKLLLPWAVPLLYRCRGVKRVKSSLNIEICEHSQAYHPAHTQVDAPPQ